MSQWTENCWSNKLKYFAGDKILPKWCFWFDLFNEIVEANLGQLWKLEVILMFWAEEFYQCSQLPKIYLCDVWCHLPNMSMSVMTSPTIDIWLCLHIPNICIFVWPPQPAKSHYGHAETSRRPDQPVAFSPFESPAVSPPTPSTYKWCTHFLKRCILFMSTSLKSRWKCPWQKGTG